MYSDLNFLWEAWLGVRTETKQEAIENHIQEKSVDDYSMLMRQCFSEFYRILKSGRWMTVEFSNTSASIWNSIQSAISDAGFIVVNVSTLDKKQRSIHQSGPRELSAMISTAPQIGFDRFIHIDWVARALRVRAGKVDLDELIALLDGSGLGKEAKAKTRTKLNALALEPRADLVDFIDRGVSLFAGAHISSHIVPFAWGAAIAAYPYFGRVAEFTGRLTSIQGDCSVAEVHRRISEVYGDREVTKRATQAVLQTQANWGAIARVEKGKRLVRLAARGLTDQQTVAWLVEAALRYQGKAMALATLQSTAVLYPFLLDQPLAYVVSKSDALELRSEGSSQQFVALQAATWE